MSRGFSGFADHRGGPFQAGCRGLVDRALDLRDRRLKSRVQFPAAAMWFKVVGMDESGYGLKIVSL